MRDGVRRLDVIELRIWLKALGYELLTCAGASTAAPPCCQIRVPPGITAQ